METNGKENLMVMPVERKDGTFALRLCVMQGELSRSMMRRVMDTMDKYDLPALRATTGQRFNLEGIPADKLDEIVECLGVAVPKMPGVAVCPGGGICKLGMQETRAVGDRLLDVIKQNGPYPFKVKSGVSGCKMACSLSFIRDIGLIATSKGWDLLFGGSGRSDTRKATLIGSGLTDDQALDLAAKALAFYRENGKKRERTSRMIERLGEDAVLKELS